MLNPAVIFGDLVDTPSSPIDSALRALPLFSELFCLKTQLAIVIMERESACRMREAQRLFPVRSEGNRKGATHLQSGERSWLDLLASSAE